MANKRSKNSNLTQIAIVDPPIDDVPSAESSGRSTKNPAAVALGRLGGLKGGAARAAALSAQKRSEIAKKAAAARWKRQ